MLSDMPFQITVGGAVGMPRGDDALLLRAGEQPLRMLSVIMNWQSSVPQGR
jgi:hypothetical protein